MHDAVWSCHTHMQLPHMHTRICIIMLSCLGGNASTTMQHILPGPLFSSSVFLLFRIFFCFLPVTHAWCIAYYTHIFAIIIWPRADGHHTIHNTNSHTQRRCMVVFGACNCATVQLHSPEMSCFIVWRNKHSKCWTIKCTIEANMIWQFFHTLTLTLHRRCVAQQTHIRALFLCRITFLICVRERDELDNTIVIVCSPPSFICYIFCFLFSLLLCAFCADHFCVRFVLFVYMHYEHGCWVIVALPMACNCMQSNKMCIHAWHVKSDQYKTSEWHLSPAHFSQFSERPYTVYPVRLFGDRILMSNAIIEQSI